MKIKTLIFMFVALFVLQINVFAQTKEEAQNIYDTAINFYNTNDFNSALYHFKEALPIHEKVYGASSPYTADIYYFWGNSQFYAAPQKEYKTAIEIIEKAYNIYSKYNEEKSMTANCLSSIAWIYYCNEEFYKAIDYYNKALDIQVKLFGQTDANTIDTYQELACVYRDIDDYKNAEKYFKIVLDFNRNTFGQESLEIAQILSYLGTLYITQGEYQQALECYDQIEKIYNKNNISLYSYEVGSFYHEKGRLYWCLENHPVALEYTQKAFEIFTKIYGENNKHTLSSIQNIAGIYMDMGDNSRALAVSERAINIHENVFGNKNTRNLAGLYYNSGILQLKLSEYDKALLSFTTACDMYCELVGKEHSEVAKCYSSISSAYGSKGDYENAIKYLEKAHILYYNLGLDLKLADVFSKLAALCGDAGLYEEAENAYYEAIKIKKEFLGEESPALELEYSFLSWNLLYQGKTEKAIENFRKAYKSAKHSTRHSATMHSLKRIFKNAKIYHYDTDTDFMRETLALAVETVEKARLDMNSRKDELLRDALDFYYHGVALEANANNPAKAFEYSEMLRSRGFLDQLGTERAMYLDGVTDKERAEIKSLSDEITNARETIDYQVNLTLDKRDTKALANAEKKLNESEKALKKLDDAIAKRLPVYGELRNPQPAKLKDAQKWCGKNRAILEYVLYEPQEVDAEPFVYCIVLTNKKITTVKLNANFDYSSKVSALRDVITKRPLKSEVVFEDVRNELYAELVEPVLPYIDRNIKNLMIVPDGNLAFLPFDILRPNADADDFGKKYNISISPSVSVSMLERSKNPSKNILAFGGSWYDATLSESEHDEVLRGRGTRGQNRSLASVTTNTTLTEQDLRNLIEQNGTAAYFANKKLHWQDLPGTIYELEELKKGAFKNATVQTQKTASEAVLKEFSKSKKLGNFGVLHFACHGYFDPDLAEMSSVLFSEVSGKLDNSIEDGYLTIGEASSLNLNADMVCLSACQTGLGKTQKGEGMIGLSRAFMVAGAKNVGVTLWSVDDSATAEFMRRMYNKVALGMSYAEAYRKVKNEFRNSDEYSHPYYWAAFCLYE